MANLTVRRSVFGLVAAALAAPVFAQQQTDSAFLEEIVVTSSKRESTLQEIPIAVSVIQAADLQESRVLDVKDLQFLVPSLRVTQLQTSGNTNFLIRGFGNGANNAGIEPSVGVFIDGVYRSRSASALNDLPNLERIEVLRGPQSTLFGKNASAGVISVVTEKPSLEGYTGSAAITLGDDDQIIVSGDVSGPLSDTVGFSLSASVNQRDGYYDNLAGGDELGELDRWGLRGQLLIQPSNDLEFRFIADYEELDEACCGVANLLDGDTGDAVRGLGGQFRAEEPFAYAGFYDYTPTNEFENGGVSLQIDYNINDSMTLTSITSFRNLERLDNADSDFTSAQLISETAGNRTDLDIDTITQELRLAGSTERMDWMVGGYYFDEEIDQDTGISFGAAFRPYADLLTGGLPGNSLLWDLENNLIAIDALLPADYPDITPGIFYGAEQGLFEASTMDNQAFSLFGQVDIALGERATLTLGANYTEDEKDVTFDSTQTDVLSSLDMEFTGGRLIYAAAFQEALLGGADPVTADAIASATEAALAPVPCSATNPPPACNPALELQPFQFLPPNVDFPNSVEDGSTDDDDVTWTVRLAYDVNDQVNVYGSAATGFKASSWNLSRDSRPFPEDQAALEAAGLTVNNLTYSTRFAEPEESTVYEIGMKARWDTVALNVAIFDQEIEDFQSNTFVGTGFVLLNAGEQSTTGLEFDLRWVPTENFEGTLAATFMDPEYDSFEQAACVPPEGSTSANFTCDLSGETPSGIHEVSITATGRYSFMIADIASFIRAEYIYEDEIQVIDNVPEDVAAREVSTFNASFGMAWENGFEALLWGRNLTDDEYLVSAFPTTVQIGSYSGYPNQPRTYGITVRKFFD